MKTEDVLEEFLKVGALLEGHFILSSGRRSPVFLQKALVFSHPKTTERLCAALARKLEALFEKMWSNYCDGRVHRVDRDPIAGRQRLRTGWLRSASDFTSFADYCRAQEAG